MDENTILDAVVARVTALGLMFADTPITIQKRKVPKRLKDDPPVVLNVCKSPTPDEVKRHTNKHSLHTYYTEISIIAANDGDQVATLPDQTARRNALVNAFAVRPADLMGLDNLRDVKAVPKDFLPRDMLGKNIDYQVIEVMTEIVEIH